MPQSNRKKRQLDSKFVDLLACPECHGGLYESNATLRCKECSASYEIRSGIPIMLSKSTDIQRLQGEEELAEMMKQTSLYDTEQFSLFQWSSSKTEFWNTVCQDVDASYKTLINLGCGYDNTFRRFEEQGCMFINFDIVYDMLYFLKQKCGAKFCVAGDVNHLPLKKGAFDCVISIDVIHHMSERIPALIKSFKDLLHHGGKLFLEDPNAWGLFQFYKSILLPKSLYKSLRSLYHSIKRSNHKPADYEFPTNIWSVVRELHDTGFTSIRIFPNRSYPCINKICFQLYRLMGSINWVRKYHNYHYMLSASIR